MGESSDYANLQEAILTGDATTATEIGDEIVANAESVLKPIDVAAAVIREVGNRFGAGELYLPEMVLAAEAMQAFMDVVTPQLKAEAGDSTLINRGTVVIGTVQGDIHSIGKNIVATMQRATTLWTSA